MSAWAHDISLNAIFHLLKINKVQSEKWMKINRMRCKQNNELFFSSSYFVWATRFFFLLPWTNWATLNEQLRETEWVHLLDGSLLCVISRIWMNLCCRKLHLIKQMVLYDKTDTNLFLNEKRKKKKFKKNFKGEYALWFSKCICWNSQF